MLSKSHEPDWLYLFKWVPNKTLILKLEWKSKTNLSITVTIKATDHLRYLRICPDEIIYCSHSFKIPWRNISFTNFCETKYEQIGTVCISNIPRTIFTEHAVSISNKCINPFFLIKVDQSFVCSLDNYIHFPQNKYPERLVISV